MVQEINDKNLNVSQRNLTEVNLVRHKKVFNELMKKVSFVINEFEPTYGYSNRLYSPITTT